MKKSIVVFFLTFLMLGLATFTNADDNSAKLKGYMIGEYFYGLANHSDAFEGENGFWFRRIYLTYDNSFSKQWKVRLRFEADSNPPWDGKDKLHPVVKNAYLQYKLKSGMALKFGIQSSLDFATVEDFWGYRHVEKTPLDLYKFSSSRDFGISVSGGKKVEYAVLFGNGSSNKSETNQGKVIHASFSVPTDNFLLNVTGHYDAHGENDTRIMISGFGGLIGDFGKLGANFAYINYDDKDMDWTVISAFGILHLTKKANLIARFDTVSNPVTGPAGYYVPFATTESPSFVLAGIDFKPHKNVHIGPFVKVVMYDGDLDTDIWGLLTCKYKFGKGY